MLPGSQHFKGRGACWSSGMGTRKNDKHQLFTWSCTNQITSWLVHSLNIFCARTSHGQTRTHKTHHGPDLGEATTFPLIVYSMADHKPASKWHLVPGLPSESLEIPKLGTPMTLGAHNFLYRTSIEMRSKAKL
jgi:hypothetical protein